MSSPPAENPDKDETMTRLVRQPAETDSRRGIVVNPRNGNEIFHLHYESLHNAESKVWCTIEVHRLPGLTVIIATDESNRHQGVSVTNRVERIMLLAWNKMGRPWPCAFVEHYRRNQAVSEHYDLVEFQSDGLRLVQTECWSGGKAVGKQFNQPQWQALSHERSGALPKGRGDAPFVLPARYGTPTPQQRKEHRER